MSGDEVSVSVARVAHLEGEGFAGGRGWYIKGGRGLVGWRIDKNLSDKTISIRFFFL